MCMGPAHSTQHRQTRNGPAKSSAFCEGRTSRVTAMLADLQWNTLQQRRMQCKTVMLYSIVHQLIAIPTTPFLIPGRSFRGHDMKFMIPQSLVNVHLHSFFPSAIRLCNQQPFFFNVSALSLETFKDRLPPNVMYEGCQESSWTPIVKASNEPDFDIHHYISLK